MTHATPSTPTPSTPSTPSTPKGRKSTAERLGTLAAQATATPTPTPAADPTPAPAATVKARPAPPTVHHLRSGVRGKVATPQTPDVKGAAWLAAAIVAVADILVGVVVTGRVVTLKFDVLVSADPARRTRVETPWGVARYATPADALAAGAAAAGVLAGQGWTVNTPKGTRNGRSMADAFDATTLPTPTR